jgi:hypothetical protein
MSTLQVLDASDAGTALRIARAVSGRGHRQQDNQPDAALVDASQQFTITDGTILKQEIKRPRRPLIDMQYDAECREALGPLLEELLDQFEAVGWNRNKAAYEMMYFAARRMNAAK